MIEEFCNRHYPWLPYAVLQDPGESYIDDVHREVSEWNKVWNTAVNLRAYVLPSDQAHPLSVFGIEELRDVLVVVCTPSLITAGLASQDEDTYVVTLGVGPGDRFTYHGDIEYEVLEWRKSQTWGNTDVPIVYQATAEKVRRAGYPYASV